MTTPTPPDPSADPVDPREGTLAAASVFAWDKGDLTVSDEEQRNSYRRPALSPSTAKAMSSCPARWAAEKALGEASDPFSASEIGTSAHSVLEDLYDTDVVEQAERTPEKAMGILLAHSRAKWPGKDEETFAKRGLWISEVHDAYRGVFDIEDPTTITVRDRELAFGGKGMPEVEVNGVPIVGFIDRVDETPDGARPLDYKSSAKKPRLKFGDDHGDQLRLYHETLRVLDGREPAGATLYYTRLGVVREVPTTRPQMRKTLGAFKRSWVALNKFIDRGAFPTKPSPLCGWCPLVSACPAASANGYEARVPAPSAVELGIPVIREYDAADLTAIERKKVNDRTPSMDLDFGSAMTGEPVDDAPPAPVPDDATPESNVVPVDTVDSGYRPPEDPGSLDADHPVSEPVDAAHLDDVPNNNTSNSQRDEEVDMNDLLHEDKPFYEMSHGTLNPNSYASIAVFGTATWAYEEIFKAGMKPNKATIDGLAQTFAHIVAAGQFVLTGSDSFQEGANTRIRGALRAYIEAHPIPFGGDKATWDEWVNLGVKHVRSIAQAALRLYEADCTTGEPWSALAVESAQKSA